jgi:hypothetical protein
LWIINAHTTEEKEEIKDDFYQTLEAKFDSLPYNVIKVLMGGFNAKIGREEERRGIMIEQHSLYEESSNNGVGLINFANGIIMIIRSTCFPHKNVSKEIGYCQTNGLITN